MYELKTLIRLGGLILHIPQVIKSKLSEEFLCLRIAQCTVHLYTRSKNYYIHLLGHGWLYKIHQSLLTYGTLL